MFHIDGLMQDANALELRFFALTHRYDIDTSDFVILLQLSIPAKGHFQRPWAYLSPLTFDMNVMACDHNWHLLFSVDIITASFRWSNFLYCPGTVNDTVNGDIVQIFQIRDVQDTCTSMRRT